jgi:DNA processing protein
LRSWEPRALLAEAEGDAILLERLGAGFVSVLDPGFPAALREIAQPPFGLFLRGRALRIDLPSIAIVGTRYPTGAGLEAAIGFARDFAALGIPVVSGLARGIDSGAHRGALASGGSTCAVLPCGVDAVYPLGNSGLAGAILSAGGLLVSEYPPGTEIRKSRFPERNRIISGLCRGLLVVEAPADSGALITADFALDQGRDVFVASSRLGGPRSAGLDRLALEGALPVAKAAEVLEAWGIDADCDDFSGLEAWGGLGPGIASDGPGDESASWGRSLAAALRAELALGASPQPRGD